MKSPMWLVEALLRDSAVQCRVPSHLIVQDLRTIRRRTESEGWSFLTISLPAFGQDFLRSLDQGSLMETGFAGFKRAGRSPGSPPALLQGFFVRIFSPCGRLLDKPDVSAIACLHQICNTFKKVKMECSEARRLAALRQYVDTDLAIPDQPGYDSSLLGVPTLDGEKIPTLRQVHQVFDLIFREALLPIDRKIFEGEPLDGKHGPGTTAEKITGNRKYSVATWHERFDGLFHQDHYLQAFEGNDLPGGRDLCLSTGSEVTPWEQERPVRVICVPKTQKGPRIIAAEPVAMQYMQQALMRELTDGIMATPVGRCLNFNDQTRNGLMALSASKNGLFATLDLKEASDRVPFWLVSVLFSSYPHLAAGLDATRSRSAEVPVAVGGDDGRRPLHAVVSHRSGVLAGSDAPRKWRPGLCEKHRFQSAQVRSVPGLHSEPNLLGADGVPKDRPGGFLCEAVRGRTENDRTPCSSREPITGSRGALGDRGRRKQEASVILDLKKFASMGSATCFVVEAMVFLAIAVTCVALRKDVPVIKDGRVNPVLVKDILDSVLVFGDDIVVPSDCAPAVTVGLKGFNLMVNRSKSFWTGKFRESCGTDAYDGDRITPVYCRNVDWGDSKSLDWLSSWVEFSNQLYMSGFWETARTVREKIAREGYRIPMATEASAAVAYHNVRRTHDVGRWSTTLHRWEIRAHTFRSSYKDDPIDGVAALRKTLTRPAMDEDASHLARVTRSASVNTKKRWVVP